MTFSVTVEMGIGDAKYTVRREDGCILIGGGIPITDFVALMKSAPKGSVANTEMVDLLVSTLSVFVSLFALLFAIQDKAAKGSTSWVHNGRGDQDDSVLFANPCAPLLFLATLLLLAVVPQLVSAPHSRFASYATPYVMSRAHTSEIVHLAIRENRAEARCMSSARCRTAAWRTGL